MSAIQKIIPTRPSLIELHSGDRLSSAQFHEAYSRTPEDFRAELIGGIVYVASPLRHPHGSTTPVLNLIVSLYAAATPGVDVGENATVLLGEDSEPQPDLLVRLLPEYGGRSHVDEDEYLAGPPELVIEVAHSSYAIDLHAKRADYTRFGVQEYVVASLADERLYWFDLTKNYEYAMPEDGICRSKVFPGLWIDGTAVFKKERSLAVATLNAGLASPEHAEFVRKLEGVRAANPQ